MKLTTIGPNQHELTIGLDLTVYFSYATPVAAHVRGEGFHATDRKWSSTTSKHIRAFTGGQIAASHPQEWFDGLPDSLDEVWKPTGGTTANKGAAT